MNMRTSGTIKQKQCKLTLHQGIIKLTVKTAGCYKIEIRNQVAPQTTKLAKKARRKTIFQVCRSGFKQYQNQSSNRRVNDVLETVSDSPVENWQSESELKNHCWPDTLESVNKDVIYVQNNLDIKPGRLKIKLGKIDLEI